MRPTDADLELSSIDWEKGGGLLPAIIQDADTRQVLMLGYMNAEALAQTISSGKVTFFSRSRNTLWQKGEISGNTLSCISIKTDCDKDTFLVLARPMGPVCHLGTQSCFDDGIAPGIGFLVRLQKVIADRISESEEKSYTAKLFAAGTKRIAQKVGEESVEVALAATAGDIEELKEESADLLYHLLVLLRDQQVDIAEVIDVLRARHQTGN